MDDIYDEEGDSIYGEDEAAALDYNSDAGTDPDPAEGDADAVSHRHQENYTVLKEADIRELMEDDITELSTVLSIPKVEARILLIHYDWNVSKVHDAWFADEQQVREKVGLLEKQAIQLPSKLTCGICFESYPRNMFSWATCGHVFCTDCLSCYISTSINDGPRCLELRCPEPSCRAALGQDMIYKLASEDEKKKYARHLVSSYIEVNKKIKWCPAPGCEYAVDFVVGCGNFDVSCLCSHYFCWNCVEDAHRPLDCETVAKWILKNKSDSENTTWLLGFTKPCPQCKKPIEKTDGCMHMTCREPCTFQFCWLCLDEWSGHDYKPCNRYRKERDEDELKIKKAKEYCRRYNHYYERWVTNEKSRRKANEDLQQVQSEQIEILSNIQGQHKGRLKFIPEAWKQIIECRRVLRWTYAYGYYLPEYEHAKKELFEYLQGEAESSLERLHYCTEKEVKEFLLVDDGPANNFNEFCKKLDALTRATKVYFENLVEGLGNGLQEVNSKSACSSKKGKECEENVRAITTMQQGSSSNQRASTTAQVSRRNVVDYAALGPWICDHCTYCNDSSAMTCQMCNRGTLSCDCCTYENSRDATKCEICNEPLVILSLR